MGYALCPSVTACRTDGFTFFLDRRRDRYFAISGTTADAFDRLMRGGPVSADDAARLDLLVDDRILCASLTAETPQLCSHTNVCVESALDLPVSRRVRPKTAGALVRYLSARRSIRRSGMATILERLARRKARMDNTACGRDQIAAVAAAFQRCDALIGPVDQCLPRSIAIAHRLLDHGLRPTLIMGVRAQPFAAHCWVEAGALLVSDRCDTIRPFTPILVI